MERRGRRPLGQETARVQEWRKRVESWRRSGASLAAYARRHKLNYAQLLRWRKRFKDEATVKAERAIREFIPIRLKADALSPTAWACELELPQGLKLRLRRVPTPTWLARLSADRTRAVSTCG